MVNPAVINITTVILGLDPRIQTPYPPDWIPAFAGITNRKGEGE